MIVLVACSACAPTQAASEATSTDVPTPTPTLVPGNPVPSDAESLSRGAAIYQAACARCHGEGGVGSSLETYHPPPPNMGILQQPELTDGKVYELLSGINLTHPVPTISNKRLDDRQVWDVLNYSRSLAPELDDNLNPECEDCHGADDTSGR